MGSMTCVRKLGGYFVPLAPDYLDFHYNPVPCASKTPSLLTHAQSNVEVEDDWIHSPAEDFVTTLVLEPVSLKLIGQTAQECLPYASNLNKPPPPPPPTIIPMPGGGGGTGKSYLINVLRKWTTETFLRKDEPVVAVCAPTGLAAMALTASPCNRLLQLPVEHGRAGKYYKLAT